MYFFTYQNYFLTYIKLLKKVVLLSKKVVPYIKLLTTRSVEYFDS